LSRAATVWLLVATPANPLTGARVTVRLAGGGTQGYTHFGANDWRAGLDRPPAMVQRLGYDDGSFGDGAVVQALVLKWGGRKKRADDLAALYWRDAAFTLYRGPDGGADAQFEPVLSGRMADVARDGAQLTLQMADPSVLLARPYLKDARFLGTGGAEGLAELKGRFKRRAKGKCFNVELWLLDPANNIWVATDPAFPLQDIIQVYDKGNSASALTLVPWAGSVAATLAALSAAVCPAGGAAVAPSIGCVKWWYANPGKLTCDLKGEIGAAYVDRPADIVAALVTDAGLNVAAASLVGARAARDFETGLLIDSDSSTIALIGPFLSGVSLWWALSALGEVELGAWGWTASAGILSGASVKRVKTHKPVTKLVLGYRKNNFVMNRGDIAAALLISDIVDSGGNPAGIQPGATNNSSLANPNALTIPRKIAMVREEADLESRYQAQVTRTTVAGYANTSVTTAQTAATVQRLAWLTYRNGIAPAWTNQTAESVIVGTSFDANRAAYVASLDAVDAAISVRDAADLNATNDRAVDSRNVNAPPSFYRNAANYEPLAFKDASVLGIPGCGAAASYYCELTTAPVYFSSSAVPISQYAVMTIAPAGIAVGQAFTRTSVAGNDAAWGAWQSADPNATNDRYVDNPSTRTVNETPGFHRAAYQPKTFKDAFGIGLPGFTGAGQGYANLDTFVSYTAGTAPVVSQYATLNYGGTLGQGWSRVSTSETTWGPWRSDFNGFSPPRLGTAGDVLDSAGVPVTDSRALNANVGIDASGAFFNNDPAATGTGTAVRNSLLNPAISAAGETALWSNIAGQANAPENNATRNVQRGLWASGTAYGVNDLVLQAGSSWASRTNHVATGANGPPALPTLSNADWQLFAQVGSPGTAGANGNRMASLYRRAATVPAVPTGAFPPAGWTTSVPAANGQPAWRSEVELTPAGLTVGAYLTPLLAEALVTTPASVPVQITGAASTSAVLTLALGIGESRQINAQIAINSLAAPGGTQTVDIQWRLLGGTPASLASGSDTGGAGDSLFAQAIGTLPNNTGFAQLFEVWAVTSKIGGTGTINLAKSLLSA
jgi:hypothetical protein